VLDPGAVPEVVGVVGVVVVGERATEKAFALVSAAADHCKEQKQFW